MNLYINQTKNRPALRDDIYQGDIFLDTSLRSAYDLCALARTSITQAFDGETDHQSLHKMMPVESFVDRVTALKRHFTNGGEAKALIQAFILEIGADPGIHANETELAEDQPENSQGMRHRGRCARQ